MTNPTAEHVTKQLLAQTRGGQARDFDILSSSLIRGSAAAISQRYTDEEAASICYSVADEHACKAVGVDIPIPPPINPPARPVLRGTRPAAGSITPPYELAPMQLPGSKLWLNMCLACMWGYSMGSFWPW